MKNTIRFREMSWRRLLTIVMAFGLLASACGDDGVPGREGQVDLEQEQVTLVLDFFPGGTSSVFFAAEEQGYFEEEGLDVRIESLLGAAEVIRTLVAGQAEFGYADMALMTVANQNEDAGLKALMTILQQTPMAVLSPAENGIEEPKDLVGKTVVDSAGTSIIPVWPAFLAENGVAPEDVNQELVDVAARLRLVLEGRADAMTGFLGSSSVDMETQCDCQINAIAFKDHGIQALGNGVIVREDYVDQNPDVAGRFVRAVAKAIEFTRIDPEGTVDSLIAIAGDDLVNPRPAVLEQVLQMIPLMSSPAGGGDPPGFMTEEDWQSTVDLMVKSGQIEEGPEDISDFYTNEFVGGSD